LTKTFCQREIKGQIFAGKDTISYANLALKSADSNEIVEFAYSNEMGTFIFSELTEDDYLLIVTSLGYKKKK